MEERKVDTCTACCSSNVQQVLKIDQVPAHCNVLWNDRTSAMNCPKGDIQLNFCNDCGHLYNQAFDNELMTYSLEYENTLDFSPAFQKYSHELVDRLTSRYDLFQKDIIEIGCGKGDFLKMICKKGENRGYGFDKSYDPTLENEPINSVQFIQDFYTEKYADYPADMVVSRHVLEHIDLPEPFISNIKSIVRNDSPKTFYFEVPNILYTLRDLGIWDLIYEHCSYFSAPSIAGLFQNQGFKVLDVRENYGGQFLSIEASTSSDVEQKLPETDVETVKGLVEKFSASFEQKVNYWKQKLDELQSQHKNIVVWGGGSKGVTFLNFLKTAEKISYIVDINPRKTGMYVAGTGQKYVLPVELKKINPDVVIIMNPMYKYEITNELKQLGIKPELLIA